MSINIQEEYYKIIENNKFSNLPSQELIDFDEKVALAVWKNYVEDRCYNRYNDESYFKYITDWSNILNHYKENVNFWKKADISSELFDNEFEKCFPMVYKELIKDKEYLLEKYNSDYHNQSLYLNLIEKIDGLNLNLRKDFLLNNPYEVNENNLKELQKDVPFLLALMKKHPTSYEYLNETLKEDERFLILAAQKYYSFLLLNEQHQMTHIVELLKSNVSLSELKKLSECVKNKIMETTTDSYILLPFFKEDKGYKENLLSALNRDTSNKLFDKVISELDEKSLKSLFKNNLDIFQPKFNYWLANLTIDGFSNYDKKMAALSFIDLSLKDKLNKSYEYNLNIVKTEGQRINLTFLKEYVDILLKKIDSGEISKEKAEKNAIKAKKMLPVEILKELKLQDKGILNYFLFENLNKNINDNNDKKTIKPKI